MNPIANNTAKLLSTDFIGEGNSPTPNKTLQSKSLGADPALAQWYEMAYDYYQGVTSGRYEAPTRQEWDEFLYQMNWAYDQLYAAPNMGSDWGNLGSSWQESASPDFGGSSQNSTPAPDPYGGTLGPQGSLVHTGTSAEIGYVGGDVRDIWSNEININIGSLAAQVTAEKTMDTRMEPAEEVLKIIVRDPATGTEAVYFIHDYQDAQVQLNVPEPTQVQDLTQGAVQIGSYQEAAGETNPEASLPGELIDPATNHYFYEGYVGDILDFWPQAGKDSIFDVYGDANISLRPSDQVKVVSAPPMANYDYILIVEHRDGSIDQFYLRDEFKTQINGVEEYITFDLDQDGVPDVEPSEIPSDLKDVFTINAGTAGSNDSVGAPGDTAPDEVDGDTAHYNQSEDVEVTANFDDDVSLHQITAPGEVTIHKSSYADEVSIWENPEGTYTVVVKKDGRDDQVETYIIEGASKIILDFLPGKITGDAADDPIVDVGESSGTGGSSYRNLPDNLEQLAEFLRISPEELIEAVRAAYPHAPTREEDLMAWLTPPTFPPVQPDAAFMDFLMKIDPLLEANFLSLRGKNVYYADGEAIMRQVQNRVVELLQQVYPDQANSISAEVEMRELQGNITGTYAVFGIQFGNRFFEFWSAGGNPVVPEDLSTDDFNWK